MTRIQLARLGGAVAGAIAVSAATVAITASAAGLGVGRSAASGAAPTKPAAATASADCQKFLGAFASNLKSDPAKLDAAYKAALASSLKEAVAAGRLTAAQADGINAKAASSGICGGALAHLERPPVERVRMDINAALADALKITPAALKSDLKAGQSIQAIAGAGGVTEQAFEATVVADLSKNLDTALAAKQITQAQHDAMAAKLPATAKALWSRSAAHSPKKPGIPAGTTANRA